MGRLLAQDPRSIGPELALLASLGGPDRGLDDLTTWSLVPAQLARASFAALRGEHDQARADVGSAQAALQSMRAWLRDEPEVMRSRDLDLPPVDGALSFISGAAPSREELPLDDLAELADHRRACAAGDVPTTRGGDPLDLYGRACRGDLRAVVDGQRERLYAWDDARGMLVAIAPVLGEAPKLAETLSAAPLLPDLGPPVGVAGAYGLATQMWMIYDALGHAELAGLWRRRALNLQDVLLAREPAVPLAVLSSLILSR